MSLGRRRERQEALWVSCHDLPESPGNPFYEKLNSLLEKAGFDVFVENLCAPFYADNVGRRSIPPGRYFRMLLLGYFEGIDSERGICWRLGDSLSVRAFVGLGLTESAPDHSSLSRIRKRLPLEVYHEVFGRLQKLLAGKKLFSGKFLGVDSSTMEANASLRAIVRRDTGENYLEMLAKMAEEDGVEAETKEDLARYDRKREGKRLSNREWASTTDGDARIAKLKDGRTHLAYKAEHVVDLESGAIVSVTLHPADRGDTKTVEQSLDDARVKLASLLDSTAPGADEASDVIGDKGYHSRAVLKALTGLFRARISEPAHQGRLRWHGDTAARDAVYANRSRLDSAKGKALMRARAERVERSFAHCLDRGGMRRVWLRGLENIEKRYIIHVSAFNLGILMRALFGVGTPKGWADARLEALLVYFEGRLCCVLAIWPSCEEQKAGCLLIIRFELTL